MENRKPILCVDFDGVIHDYRQGWKGGEIYGRTTPGFWKWAAEAVYHFRLVVYSSRSSTEEGRRSMAEWMGKQSIEHGLDELGSDFDWAIIFGSLEFASEKPPAFITIDDRAKQFTGTWHEFDPKALINFKPWNVK